MLLEVYSYFLLTLSFRQLNILHGPYLRQANVKGKYCLLFNVKLNFLLEIYLICYMLNKSEFYIMLALFEG